MPKQARERVNGPYKHGAQWRVVLSPPPIDGSSRYRYFASESEAQAYVDEFTRQSETRSIGEALEMYLDHLKRFGGNGKNGRGGEPLKDSSLVTVRYKVTALLGLRWKRDTGYGGDRMLTSVTPNAAQRLYTKRTKEVSPDTHRGELVQTNAFFEWTRQKPRGWITRNPFEAVLPEGRLSAGKEQLRVNEERAVMDLAAKLAAEGCTKSLAVLATDILGNRIGELLTALGRDVDDNGRLFWIDDSKTPNGRRVIEIPDAYGLRGLLWARRTVVGERAPLFGTLTRWTVRKHLHKLCKDAGVTVVTTHSLRGGRATAMVKQGRTIEEAAAYLGQDRGGKVTERSYVAPGTIETALAARKAALLTGNAMEESISTEEIAETDWN